MQNLLRRVFTLFFTFVLIYSSAFICFADTLEFQKDENIKILELWENLYSDKTERVSYHHFEFARALEEPYYFMVFDKSREVNNDVNSMYQEYKRFICDQNGDFSAFTKQEIAHAILFVTLLSVNAKDVCGYSLINELSGTDNLKKVESEGLGSMCFAYLALTCHEEYLKGSQQEQLYLINKILNYPYENKRELCLMLSAVANSPNNIAVGDWQQDKIDELAELYQKEESTINELAWIMIAASATGIDVGTDIRFMKNGKNIVEIFYNAVLEAASQNEQLDTQIYTDVLNAMLSYEKFLSGESNLYSYEDRTLYADDNYINSAIYDYLLNQSDIANHWSKDTFVKMILNSQIPYNFMEDKNIHPNESMTRGEFISWYSQAHNMQMSESDYFADITNKRLKETVNGFFDQCVFKPYHSESEKKTFISYYFGNNFRPDEKIMREEAAFFVACFHGVIDIHPQKQIEKEGDFFNQFSDKKDCTERYLSAVQYCINRKIITGRANKIAPKALLTKAEAITLIS